MDTTSDGVRRITRTSLALLIAGTALVACRSGNETTNDSAAGAVGTTASSYGGVAGASTGATASAQPAASPSSYSDAQILGALQGADSSEIQAGKVAEQKATNAAVKSFARMLVTDHTKGATQTKQLAKDSLSAQTPPGDTTATATTHFLDRLNSTAKGLAFDTAFVNHEVEDHQHDIDDTKQMVDAAKNPQVKQLLQKTLPVLQKHLDRAKALQDQLSKTKS